MPSVHTHTRAPRSLCLVLGCVPMHNTPLLHPIACPTAARQQPHGLAWLGATHTSPCSVLLLVFNEAVCQMQPLAASSRHVLLSLPAYPDHNKGIFHAADMQVLQQPPAQALTPCLQTLLLLGLLCRGGAGALQ